MHIINRMVLDKINYKMAQNQRVNCPFDLYKIRISTHKSLL